jgi:D-alanine transaminase
MGEIYLNGEFVPPEQAVVSVLDRGFLFGDGVYEVIPAYAGKPLRAREHLQRLERSLRAIGMQAPRSPAQWEPVFLRLLSSVPDADQAIYLQVTRGAAPTRDHRFPKESTPTVMAMVKPMKARDPGIAQDGVAAVVREDIRWLRCDIKATALLAAVMLRQEADEAGVEEAILVRDGLALEGSTSNLFIVLDGVLITPPKGRLLLPGITRDLVLELADRAGLPSREADVPVAALHDAEEVWITSSTREVMPVTRIDGRPVGAGRPGAYWKRIDDQYQAFKIEAGRGSV